MSWITHNSGEKFASAKTLTGKSLQWLCKIFTPGVTMYAYVWLCVTLYTSIWLYDYQGWIFYIIMVNFSPLVFLLRQTFPQNYAWFATFSKTNIPAIYILPRASLSLTPSSLKPHIFFPDLFSSLRLWVYSIASNFLPWIFQTSLSFP